MLNTKTFRFLIISISVILLFASYLVLKRSGKQAHTNDIPILSVNEETQCKDTCELLCFDTIYVYCSNDIIHGYIKIPFVDNSNWQKVSESARVEFEYYPLDINIFKCSDIVIVNSEEYKNYLLCSGRFRIENNILDLTELKVSNSLNDSKLIFPSRVFLKGTQQADFG